MEAWHRLPADASEDVDDDTSPAVGTPPEPPDSADPPPEPEPEPAESFEEEIERRTRDDGETTDGRSLRRQRNREAVIVALLDLIREGHYDPAASEIADRAGVSHRSVFRYFEDLSDLVRAAIDHEVRDTLPLAIIDDIGEGSLDERIDRLIESRLRIFHRTYGIGKVARARALGIPAIDEGLATVAELYRSQLKVHFATELDTFDPEQHDTLIDAVQVVVSFESFDFFRRRLEVDDARLSDSWRFALRRILQS